MSGANYEEDGSAVGTPNKSVDAPFMSSNSNAKVGSRHNKREHPHRKIWSIVLVVAIYITSLASGISAGIVLYLKIHSRNATTNLYIAEDTSTPTSSSNIQRLWFIVIGSIVLSSTTGIITTTCKIFLPKQNENCDHDPNEKSKNLDENSKHDPNEKSENLDQKKTRGVLLE